MERLTWSIADSERALANLEMAFRDTPRRFFTEQDLKAHLFQLVETALSRRGMLFFETTDKQKVSLLHLEYPTPFRCNMSDHDFVKVQETDKTSNGGLYRRGHFDLVVLNPQFVKESDLVTVSGKNYRQLCTAKIR
jgi:hypothetical protein